MKKLGILLILLMFVICTVVGFKAAETYYHLMPTATPLAAQIEAQNQQTLFLLHVDQLKAPKPVLRSVWALFLYYGNPPSMTFLPLYQRETGMGRSLPLREFGLSSEGDISDAFVSALQDQFDLTTRDYVVMDDAAAKVFNRIFNAQGKPAQATTEQAAIEHMCAFLQANQSREGVALPWDEVLPDHFRSNLRFDLFLANWIKLTGSERRPHCKLIPRN